MICNWSCHSAKFPDVKAACFLVGPSHQVYWSWSDTESGGGWSWIGLEWFVGSKEYSNVARPPGAVGFPVGMVIPT